MLRVQRRGPRKEGRLLKLLKKNRKERMERREEKRERRGLTERGEMW